MIIRIALIAGVAVTAYVIVPALSARLSAARRSRLLARLKDGIPCTLTDIVDGEPAFKPDRPRGTDALPPSLPPARTSFLLLEKSGTIRETAWKEVSAILAGTTAIVYRLEKDRFACLFHEELRAQDAEKRLAAAVLDGVAPERPDPVKPISIAAGAFAEFAILVDALKRPESDAISILALLAIFGKALPWCPPGLLLTLAAKSLSRKSRGGKKSRRLGTVGLLLAGLAVALNVALILFVIVGVWLPVP